MNKLFWGCLALCFTFMIQGCKQNMDLNPQDYFSGQQLTLAKAIEDGKVEDVEKLASETDLNKPGQHDMTLLFWSIMNAINDKKTPEHLKVITVLVKAGADPLQPRPEGKSSPAEYVLKADSGDWIKAMLDGGLSPDAKDKTFHEPIIFQAIKAKNTDTLKTMLDAGANINITDSLGNTLLIDALDYGKHDHVLLLLDRGADPEIKADNGWTMGNQLQRLLNGAKEGSEHYQSLNEIKEKLIEHGGKWPPVPVK
ncbi:ankyrin repeat domain-containing protein [Cronobacter sakazakii]|uniref:ankyrin repeat domain-containing protein n=1 Tax=Cronobacter sakazakii TaxID=28141 RepID=UPI000CFC3B35|nr:ankyrin repeat domain-containing protein [Cronobacter sakazakii]ELY2666901.1 ankyrin repeat domain-containing protein [Cronobacter sakazakii]ELY2746941.1 ankyrin repeat domain-containing protein [Cronobacter sakazakii]ELY4372768.1 ankyrin repeat domain-containing protein [Cronobacter sakazakii]PQY66289.1 Accessory protein [Cronobacter sakazakii]PRV93814.1 Accessory protein [Cronobacter sakazakii]